MAEKAIDLSLTPCLICASPVGATHYGVVACRACAEFFKRTKRSGKTYVCRQGQQECVITKGETICRWCRFNQCIAAGMVYERGPNVQKDSDDENMASTSGNSAEESILQRIGRLFNASVESRRDRELQLLQSRSDSKYAPHPTQKIYMSSYATSMLIFDISVAETRPLFEKAFPAITKLSLQDQNSLCKSYMPKFCLIDNAYRTRKVWGEYTHFRMHSVLTTIDLTRPELWLVEGQGGQNRQSLIAFLDAQFTMQQEMIAPMMERSHITEKEFHAVIALVICEIDASIDVSDETLSVLDDIRAEILADLQRYYVEEIGLNDFSTRLGHLISLLHISQECVSVSAKYIMLQQTIFDMYSADDLSDKLKEVFN